MPPTVALFSMLENKTDQSLVIFARTKLLKLRLRCYERYQRETTYFYFFNPQEGELKKALRASMPYAEKGIHAIMRQLGAFKKSNQTSSTAFRSCR